MIMSSCVSGDGVGLISRQASGVCQTTPASVAEPVPQRGLRPRSRCAAPSWSAAHTERHAWGTRRLRGRDHNQLPKR